MDQYREVEQDDPVAAFEQLRGEVALLRRAVEGLTAARESIDIPDYEPTLARTEKILALLARQIDAMRQSPAMTLTPETMGSRMNASIREAANAVRGEAQASKAALDGAVLDLRRLTGAVRHAKEQRSQLLMAGGGGLALGLLLYAALAGPIARMMPASWQWPERMAARMLGEPTIWGAGKHLMVSASPQSWDAIAAAANLVRDNRETIEGCRKAAAKAEKAVRCTIEVE
ncbi:hypothetical protein L288_18365 [Sphingobium quisquiliarum P25]|uniref:Uncharacterized protein n=1 Tax=Sphingobium quisquiliarum P25 TaxID=1329909 RepID=T0GIA9_9SPHN|nr:DUF6118 family protein [Sphingobium quisquiliarum]EQB00442.1 hypothetical protein L288_18365 [Sphingobium quisquiliarum P25]